MIKIPLYVKLTSIMFKTITNHMKHPTQKKQHGNRQETLIILLALGLPLHTAKGCDVRKDDEIHDGHRP
jgi:hypothetical protein